MRCWWSRLLFVLGIATLVLLSVERRGWSDDFAPKVWLPYVVKQAAPTATPTATETSTPSPMPTTTGTSTPTRTPTVTPTPEEPRLSVVNEV